LHGTTLATPKTVLQLLKSGVEIARVVHGSRDLGQL
jgi:hypothetical protein